ncbi:hypothetical protein ACHAWF_004643 [Thalassiosira exigua]
MTDQIRSIVSTILLYKKGREHSIYHPVNVLNTTHDEPSKSDRQGDVPLILHRMWRDDHILNRSDPELPANWSKAFADCTEHYRQRNWTTILWTDETIRGFLAQNFPSFLPEYDAYRYDIQRADAARYFILFHFGGVYMDLDIGCRRHRDMTDIVRSMKMSRKMAVLPQTEPFGLSNDIMFATKGSPFFKALLDALPKKNLWYGSPYLTVLYSTGPMFVSLQYAALPPSNQSAVLALPPELYTERQTRYFVHLRGSTWHRNDARAVRWMVRNWSVLIPALLVSATVIVCRRRNRTTRKHAGKIV